MRSVLITALALTLALSAAPAGAATYTGPRAQWLTWEEAVSRVPGPRGAIVLREGSCPGAKALGCADVDGGEMWLATRQRFVAAHERGHFFDARNLDDWERGELKSLMGVPADQPWEKRQGLHDDACGVGECPNEMFADAYANCALGRSPAGKRRGHGRVTGGWFSPYGYAPTPLEHQVVCASIREYA